MSIANKPVCLDLHLADVEPWLGVVDRPGDACTSANVRARRQAVLAHDDRIVGLDPGAGSHRGPRSVTS